jgi:hypothetical protein
MLVFKENVKGFIYNSINGQCYNSNSDFDNEDDDFITIDDVELLNELFIVTDKEQLMNDEEDLNLFVEFK